MSITDCFARFVREDEGQDLVEYAYLVFFTVLLACMWWVLVRNAIATGYVTFDTNEQAQWQSPNPG